MYIHVWNKYLPIIRILMKRSANGDQKLDLNRIDFERAGSARKAGYKFNIEITRGTVANVISGSPLALDLATVLLGDSVVKGLIQDNDFIVSLNTKFQLMIQRVRNGSKEEEVQETPVEEHQPGNE